MTLPFWKMKTLSEMTRDEWESLCDGCGKCCLIKLEDEDTGLRLETDVSCKLFNPSTCRCKQYELRKTVVPDCVVLTPTSVHELPWIPKTCAYRLLAEGKDLYDWHPLVTGDPDSTHKAGMSVINQVRSEESFSGEIDWDKHIVEWPGEGDEDE
ncbi:MAG: YcgN family cysteine cluster protein [Maricaulis sp.]|uniref:YcgN family cysteine cluster protein n=1 Tax=Maricaulis sp. TaxID=1486257 RepID=UPI002618ED48|nr:YcgN family cysteine cluster protein [Maricaulis sp.]MDM7985687.1 YcgN family cysteine cluster protein [Maricaulis sp.]